MNGNIDWSLVVFLALVFVIAVRNIVKELRK